MHGLAMIHSLDILAADGGLLLKLVPFLIFLAIWGLGALATAVSKSKQAGARRLPPPVAPRSNAQIRPVQNRPVPPRLPPTVAQQTALPPLSQRTALKRPPARPRVVPPPRPRQPAPAPPKAETSPPAARPANPPPPGFLRASTIREQFVLSEILGKPLALHNRPRLPLSSGWGE